MRPIDLQQYVDQSDEQDLIFTLSSGDRLTVSHRRYVFVDSSSLYLGVNPDRMGIPERTRIVSIVNLAGVERGDTPRPRGRRR